MNISKLFFSNLSTKIPKAITLLFSGKNFLAENSKLNAAFDSIFQNEFSEHLEKCSFFRVQALQLNT